MVTIKAITKTLPEIYGFLGIIGILLLLIDIIHEYFAVVNNHSHDFEKEGDKMDFRFNLRYFREREGLSQTELALKVGVTPSVISQYEAGAKVPSLPVADTIARTLGVTCDDLVRGERRKRGQQ